MITFVKIFIFKKTDFLKKSYIFVTPWEWPKYFVTFPRS